MLEVNDDVNDEVNVSILEVNVEVYDEIKVSILELIVELKLKGKLISLIELIILELNILS
jgi:hypothetical protein